MADLKGWITPQGEWIDCYKSDFAVEVRRKLLKLEPIIDDHLLSTFASLTDQDHKRLKRREGVDMPLLAHWKTGRNSEPYAIESGWVKCFNEHICCQSFGFYTRMLVGRCKEYIHRAEIMGYEKLAVEDINHNWEITVKELKGEKHVAR